MAKVSLNLRDIYRSTDVKRWGIVKTSRPQSVAEHSYQVAMVATRLCQLRGWSRERTMKAVWYAMVHDLPEVLTGDIATPLKAFLGSDARDGLSMLEKNVHALDMPCTEEDQEIRDLVKQADLIEAIAFLHQNSTTEHGRQVMDKLNTKLIKMGECDSALINTLGEIIQGRETTLDDLVSDEEERQDEQVRTEVLAE